VAQTLGGNRRLTGRRTRIGTSGSHPPRPRPRWLLDNSGLAVVDCLHVIIGQQEIWPTDVGLDAAGGGGVVAQSPVESAAAVADRACLQEVELHVDVAGAPIRCQPRAGTVGDQRGQTGALYEPLAFEFKHAALGAVFDAVEAGGKAITQRFPIATRELAPGDYFGAGTATASETLRRGK